MATSLTTSSSSQSQTTAGANSLQPTGQAPITGTPTSSVQPGGGGSLQGGVTLRGTELSTISLPPAPQTTTSRTSSEAAPKAAPKHHVNPAWLGGPILLLLIAVVLVWLANRPSKNTI